MFPQIGGTPPLASRPNGIAPSSLRLIAPAENHLADFKSTRSSPFSFYQRMSLISDALKKAELQRGQPSLAPTSGWNQVTHTQPYRAEPRARSSSRGLFLANVAVLVILCVAAVYFVRNERMAAATDSSLDPSDRPEAATSELANNESAIATTPVLAAEPSSGPLAQSPFLPPTTASANQPPATEEYDLGGTSTLGSNTLLSLVRRSDRRSIWIPVGKTVGEITAVSYDPETDQAVIRVRGNLMSVTMRNFMLDPADNTEPKPESAE